MRGGETPPLHGKGRLLGESPPRGRAVRANTGFSLLELLGVLALLGVLGALVAGGLVSAGADSARFASECARLEATLRALQRGAVVRAQHRYVALWNADEFPGAARRGSGPSHRPRPEEAGLYLATYRRPDNGPGFQPRDPRRSWLEQTLLPRELERLGNVQRFGMLRLVGSLPPPPGGRMQREPVSRFQRLGHQSGQSTLTIPESWKGKAIDLRRILHFCPDGSARVEHQTTAGTPVQWVELGLWPAWIPPPGPLTASEGTANASNASNASNAWEAEADDAPLEKNAAHPTGSAPRPTSLEGRLHGAIQISGLHGRVRLFLP